MSITTKRGDNGTTSALPSATVEKSSYRIEALARLDNLQAHTGILISSLKEIKKSWYDSLKSHPLIEIVSSILQVLLKQQLRIQAAMAVVSCNTYLPKDVERSFRHWNKMFHDEGVKELEYLIHDIEKYTPNLRCTGFFVPGYESISTQINLCRTECRIAEQMFWRFIQSKEPKLPLCKDIAKYLNRLSDVFYIITRYFYAVIVPKVNEQLDSAKKKCSCEKHNSIPIKFPVTFGSSPTILQPKIQVFMKQFEKHVLAKACSSWEFSKEYPSNSFIPVRRYLELAHYLREALQGNKLGGFEFSWVFGGEFSGFNIELIDIERRKRYILQLILKPICILARVFVYIGNNDSKACVYRKKFPFKRRMPDSVPLTS